MRRRFPGSTPTTQTCMSSTATTRQANRRIVRGRMAIATFFDDICSRAMTHDVNACVTEGNRLAFTQTCAYPDGTKVLCLAMVELKAGKIAQQTIVQAWDE